MNIKTGPINEASDKYKDWVIGAFVNDPKEFQSDAFEVKWSKRKKGEYYDPKDLDDNDIRKTLVILVYGKMRYVFTMDDKKVVLENESDYLFYEPNRPHSLEALEDSLVVVIRWPSKL